MYPFFWGVRVECVGGGIIGGSAHERHLLPPAPTEAAETQNECAECFCPIRRPFRVIDMASESANFSFFFLIFKKNIKFFNSINFVKIQEKC